MDGLVTGHDIVSKGFSPRLEKNGTIFRPLPKGGAFFLGGAFLRFVRFWFLFSFSVSIKTLRLRKFSILYIGFVRFRDIVQHTYNLYLPSIRVYIDLGSGYSLAAGEGPIGLLLAKVKNASGRIGTCIF